MAFFIEKIVASGAGKKESTIVFKPGANIIYGPSNTGKTYIVKCIDFLFGSDADPFDSSSGYDSISIYLKTRGGQVVMHRKLGSNKIDVSSTDSTSEGIQTIVIENEIPEIDYSNVNLIHFTKNANTGRYGFLIDVMD